MDDKIKMMLPPENGAARVSLETIVMPTHNLKTDFDVFEQSWQRLKPFEIRFDDRNFQVGDELVLCETKHSGSNMKFGAPLVYTGRRIRQRILSKLCGIYGLKPGWCILGVEELHRVNEYE